MLRIFHLVMVAYLAILLSACGYKSAPFYTGDTHNQSTQSKEQQNSDSTSSHSKSIQSIDSKVVTGGEGE
ncbi:hypothetical protein ACWIWK_06670 [Helicobacter sp. 23-1048]